MKRVSSVVSAVLAGGLVFGLTAAARADVGAPAPAPAAGDTTEVTVTPPPRVDANGNPIPPTDANGNPLPSGAADVDVNPAAPMPPPAAAGAPGSVETAPAGSATVPSGADVNVNPPAPPAVAAPRPGLMPPARVMENNTAAINGNVLEPTVPIQLLPPGPGYYDHGTAHDNSHALIGRLGAGFLVGGGFEDFTNSTLRSQTGGGGAWNARLVAGTRQYLGVEAAYVGAARSVDALGVGSNAVLLSNGVEGAARLNLPIAMRRAQLLEPFGFVGLGWSHYQVTNTNVNTSDLAKDDDVMAVPLGAGLEYAVGRFMADARFTYRSTYYNDLMRTGGSLNNWGVGGQIGFAF